MQLKPILVFIPFPFAEAGTEEISATISSMSNLNEWNLEAEILNLQCDISTKARAYKKNPGIYSIKNSTQTWDQQLFTGQHFLDQSSSAKNPSTKWRSRKILKLSDRWIFEKTASTCAYVIMNPLSASYCKICSVMHQLHNTKVKKKHLFHLVWKKEFLINKIIVLVYVLCFYAVSHFFAQLT